MGTKPTVTQTQFELMKALSTNKQGRLVEVDPELGPIYEITDRPEGELDQELRNTYDIIPDPASPMINTKFIGRTHYLEMCKSGKYLFHFVQYLQIPLGSITRVGFLVCYSEIKN